MLAADHVLSRSANEPLLRHFPAWAAIAAGPGASTAVCQGVLLLRDVGEAAVNEARKDFQ
jgi:hypothetical protein